MADFLQPGAFPALMDPRSMGILAAAFQGMNASGPSRMPVSMGQVIGQAGLAGLGAYQGAAQQQMQAQAQKSVADLHQMQIEKMRQESALAQQQQAYFGQLAQKIPEADRSMFMAAPTKYIEAKLKAMMDNPFAKISPNDYTPESLRAFAETKNPALLVPIRKQEHVTTTDESGKPVTKWVDPYSPPSGGMSQPMTGFLGQLQSLGLLQPGQENNPQVQQILSGYIGKESGQLTPDKIAELKIKLASLGNDSRNTWFNTGGSAGVPSIPGAFSMVGMSPTQNIQAPMNRPGFFPSAPAQTPTMAPRPAAHLAAPPPSMTNGMVPKAVAQQTADKEKERQKALADLPDLEAKARQTISVVEQLLQHPGFSDVVGATWRPGMRFVHGSNAAGADALLDQIKGQQFLQAFESLKGGGQITEIEGKKATDAISRMNRSQSESEFKAAAKEFTDIVRASLGRAYQRAGKPFPEQFPPNASGAVGGPQILRFDANGNQIP